MALLSLPSNAQSLLSLDFTNFNFTPITNATVLGGVVDSVYEATSVADLGGVGGVNSIDAHFTITDASVNNNSLIFFEDSATRGTNARLRFLKNSSADIWARVSISFVDSVTSNAVDVNALTGDYFRLQFDDLDSDVGRNRADFAGLANSDIDAAILDPGSELELNTTLQSGYTVGVLPQPYGPEGNVTGNTPADQAPVTVGFNTTSEFLQVVLGVTGPDTGSRHIHIDMTPNFVLVPEPSTALLCGLSSLLLFRRRRS